MGLCLVAGYTFRYRKKRSKLIAESWILSWSDLSQQASAGKQCILEQLNELAGPLARLLTEEPYP